MHFYRNALIISIDFKNLKIMQTDISTTKGFITFEIENVIKNRIKQANRQRPNQERK